MIYKVNEIFDSVQGEGAHLGVPATFIRLAGCNLACSWCDTDHETVNMELSSREIVDKIKYHLVVITGGEPMLQDLEDLVKCIRHSYGNLINIAVETNATQPTYGYFNWITASPKPPYYYIHPNCIANEAKYVVTPDFDPKVIAPHWLGRIPIWLQPEGGDMQEMWKKATEIALNDQRLKVGVQLHKLMGVR